MIRVCMFVCIYLCVHVYVFSYYLRMHVGMYICMHVCLLINHLFIKIYLYRVKNIEKIKFYNIIPGNCRITCNYVI